MQLFSILHLSLNNKVWWWLLPRGASCLILSIIPVHGENQVEQISSLITCVVSGLYDTLYKEWICNRLLSSKFLGDWNHQLSRYVIYLPTCVTTAHWPTHPSLLYYWGICTHYVGCGPLYNPYKCCLGVCWPLVGPSITYIQQQVYVWRVIRSGLYTT